MTEKPPFDPWNDIRRHPLAQFGEAKNFYRKSYDMYSLGVVLLEISLWKPLEVIMGIEDLMALKPADLRGIRGKLLGSPQVDSEITDGTLSSRGSECLSKVARKCGDSYRDIVELCLSADEVERAAYRGETHTSIKSRLRTMFKQQVTDKLRLMKEVLGGFD